MQISKLIQASSGQEQALYVLLAATGLRISEALPVESVISSMAVVLTVEQQVEKDSARIVKYLKTPLPKRQMICTRHRGVPANAMEPEKLVCCSIQRMASRIFTATWKSRCLLASRQDG